MTNLQAALGLAQLEKIESHINRKREIGNRYQKGLKEIKGFKKPIKSTDMLKIFIGYWLIAENKVMMMC